MKNVKRGIAVLAIAALWIAAPGLRAHALDEYLQATLVAIEHDRIDLEISLTPGVSIAANVVASIDRDGSGGISPVEGEAYARAVLREITLQVDGRAHAVTLTGQQFPTPEAMREGLGTIRVKATVPLQSPSGGRHEILYRNVHRPDLSVYLANALVPSDQAITIARQQRDVQQHELRIDYRVEESHSKRAVGGLLATLFVIFIARRRRRT